MGRTARVIDQGTLALSARSDLFLQPLVRAFETGYLGTHAANQGSSSQL